MIRLAARTLPVFAIIVGFAVALAAYLNFSGVRTAYLDLIRSRMEMTAAAIAADIVTANSLGIPLPEQTTLAELLVRQAATVPLLQSIDVTESGGNVLFSSDPARVGLSAADDNRTLRHTLRVTNDFGVAVGAVAVRLDRTSIEDAIEGLRRDLLTSALPAGVAAVVAGCLGALLLLTHLHRRARRFAALPEELDPIGRAERELARLTRERAA